MEQHAFKETMLATFRAALEEDEFRQSPVAENALRLGFAAEA
jgi:hypothetical protein